MLLPVLLAAQLAQAVPACAALDALLQLDLRVAGECRLTGVSLPDAAAGDLPFRTLHVAGAHDDATASLRRGLDHFVRVTTRLAEAFPRGAIRSAFSDFEDAIRTDPSLTEAALAATALALRTRVDDDVRRALDIVEAAADGERLAAAAAELRLARGEAAALRERRDLLDDVLGRRIVAIALLESEDPALWGRGDSLYFDAARADVEALRRARVDLQPLLPELTIGDAAQLERTWDALAAEAAVDRPRRLHVHFDRLAEAYARYYDWPRIPSRMSDLDVPTWFDARGTIYLRHGEPDRRIISNAEINPEQKADIMPVFESWIYERGWSGGYALHFAGQNRDWHFLVAVPGCDDDWIQTRAELYAGLGSIWMACTRGDFTTARTTLTDIARDMRAEQRDAIASQSVDIGLRDLLVARGSIHRFRDAQGQDEILIVAGVAVEPGITDTLGVGAEFTLEMEAHVASAAGSTRAATRATRRTTDVSAAGYASSAVLLHAPPASALARVVLRDADSTHVGAALSLPVSPSIGESMPDMSDVILLAAGAPGTLRRFGRWLAPLPDVVVIPGSFGLYFELYDLPDDASSYRATMRARRTDAGAVDRLLGRADDVELSFERAVNRVTPGTSAELLEVTAPDWRPGTYELEVRVRIGERTLTRTRTLVVEE